jgi:cell division septation protein DedD
MPLSKAPTDLKERAKQGDEKAIAAVLNHFFQPQGITAKATLKQGNLLLLIESEMVPDQDTLVPFIHQGLANLGIANINPKVKIGGRQIRGRTAWQQQIDLEHPPRPILADGENDDHNDLPLVDDDDMPIEDNDFLNQRSMADDDDDDYALEGDSSKQNQKSSKKFSKKNLLILVVLFLLLLGAVAAVYFFFLLPGFLAEKESTDSQPTSVPSSPTSPEKPADASKKASEAKTAQSPEATSAPKPTPGGSPTPVATATAPQNASTQGQSPQSTPTNGASSASGSATISVPFYQAVNKANQAWEITQVASSSEDWEKIAVLWNDALVLMKEVPADHANYSIAQDRIPKYTKYRDFAKHMVEITSR